jgi:uncharacterized protein YfiM (DUF2279 family)
MQMDKLGHVGSAYYLTNWGTALFKNAGMESKRSAWTGGMSAMLFLTTVEVFDGFSDQWGFSYGDMAANAAGSSLSIWQQLRWQEQRIQIKFSFSQSPYAKYRRNQLGSNYHEQLLKDYNGQTYWISTNIASFCSKSTRLPKWLNLAIGYGVDGLTGARANIGGTESFKRSRMFYLSPDIDLTKLTIKNRFLKTVCSAIGFIKFPLPALEIGDDGVHGKWVVF